MTTPLDSPTLSLKQLFQGESQIVAACGPVRQHPITGSPPGIIDTVHTGSAMHAPLPAEPTSTRGT